MIPNVTHAPLAIMALFIFLFGYFLVIIEEFIQLKKSKPMLLGAGIIWVLVAWLGKENGLENITHNALRHTLTDFSELLLFVIVAMTYVNALIERKVFEVLRIWLIRKHFSYKTLFWITGTIAFFISAIADNLTTAIAMSAVIVAIGKNNGRFITLACINLVVAANAGGAFSPFGDITTLMVWQAGLVPFAQFFKLFFPSVVNFLVPALFMHFALPKGQPETETETVALTRGGKRIIFLFLLTIATAILSQSYFGLPPAMGMMIGLGYLQLFAYYTKRKENIPTLEIFTAIQKLDWDTLLFFYGVIFSVGGLATLGYLEYASNILYASGNGFLPPHFQHLPGNVMIGLLSAIVDNIPLMFAVIKMAPSMSEGQWLLLTLTAGVGGSLLSIGSAAGIAVMGQAHKFYTFFSHLKWMWAIALGYLFSIILHLGLNANLF
jgi:Na+/H+ antiporter NhaD/arsenite permease-like protein